MIYIAYSAVGIYFTYFLCFTVLCYLESISIRAILQANPVTNNRNSRDKMRPSVSPMLIELGVYASLSMHKLKLDSLKLVLVANAGQHCAKQVELSRVVVLYKVQVPFSYWTHEYFVQFTSYFVSLHLL